MDVMPKPPPSKPIKIWRREEGPPPSYGWVCFHCGTCCETYKDAKEHFGEYEDQKPPACKQL